MQIACLIKSTDFHHMIESYFIHLGQSLSLRLTSFNCSFTLDKLQNTKVSFSTLSVIKSLGLLLDDVIIIYLLSVQQCRWLSGSMYTIRFKMYFNLYRVNVIKTSFICSSVWLHGWEMIRRPLCGKFHLFFLGRE